MEELDKTYQQVVKTLTKLEEDTGIKKSNFYVLPNSEDQAITFGLFLPNQQKEDGLKLKQKLPELESYILDNGILSTAEQLVEIMDATNVNQYLQNKVENRGPYYMAMIGLVFPLLTGKDKNVQRTIKAIINSHFDTPKCQLTTDGFAKIK